MRVSGLRIDGFKSFADAVNFPIDRGMTGIVGPNGCGKSNLFESLRWSMGETSAKRIRGNDMDDVIFGGTERRQPRNVCEVAILLDNTDRTATSQFNDADHIELVRRIERGEGSTYRLNGKTVRAKDVQLIYRDIGTGASSAAMISQGRVGAVINAKPVDRRNVLEEAAGVSGLEPRRRDAELRLQATEQNLLRAEDTAAAYVEQIERLKKEARQAQRWREIDGLIRKAEALMILARMAAVDARLARAVKDQETCERTLADAVAAAEAAGRERDTASGAVIPMREQRIRHETLVARLDARREQTQADAERASRDLAEAMRRTDEAKADHAREKIAVEEARRRIEEYSAERRSIAETQATEMELIDQASDRYDSVQATAEKVAAEVEQLLSASAASDAIRSEAARRATETAERARSLASKLAEFKTRLTDLSATRLDADGEEATRLHAEAEAVAEGARERLVEAEAATAAAREDEIVARTSGAQTEGEAAALEAELRGLPALSANDPNAGTLPFVTVTPGYEQAFAAALGREIDNAVGGEASPRWSGACLAVGPVPDGVDRLDAFVEAPGEVVPKLMGIGVVDTREEALSWAGRLEPGVTIVSKDGATVRWDGHVSEHAGDGTAERLAIEARRKEIEETLPAVVARREGAKQRIEQAALAVRTAKSAEDEARRALAAAGEAERATRSRRDGTTRAYAEAQARLTALTEQVASLEAEETAAREAAFEAEEALRGAPNSDEIKSQLETRRHELGQAKKAGESARAIMEEALRTQRERRDRMSAIAREEADHTRRLAGADERLADLDRRIRQGEDECERLDKAPEEAARIAEQAQMEIETAREALASVAAALSVAEQAAVASEIKQRDAEVLVGGLREERSRLIEAITSVQESRAEVERQIFERTGGGPAELPALAGIEPGAELPSAEASEQRHNKLLREREQLGNVNMLAEEQLATTLGDSEKLVKERDELKEAVAKLRDQIAEIDREAKQRIEEAFIKVDDKFRFLFTRLFGGGHAQLKLIDGDSPLSSGLEIYASPPGKKMQSLQLLSGGEQALTALSLVFAAFLVSPSPICVLDEVDAPLDDANVDRLCSLMEDLCKEDATRFLVVTHHAMTMSRMDRLYGVTMAEKGVSRVASINLREAEEIVAQDEAVA
ncbi:chromosome segregation protein [Bradyrhizobium sp. USDA 4341]